LIGEFPAHLGVVSAIVRREEGGYGTLTVTLQGPYYSTEGLPQTPVLLKTTREKEWLPNSRPLGEHPLLKGYDANNWAAWMNESDAKLKGEYKYLEIVRDADGNITSRTEKQLAEGQPRTFAEKVLRGVVSWTDYYMICRLTEVYDIEPATEGCGRGHIKAPEGFNGLPAGLDWLKTSDRCVQNSDDTYSRVREWTGIDGEWDTDIYGEAVA
jgi:hypothetical protein